MREYTVQFHSVNELAQFATIANRQPFPVHFDYQGSRLDAKSILSLCALPLEAPVRVVLPSRSPVSASSPTSRASSVTRPRNNETSDIAPSRFIRLYK